MKIKNTTDFPDHVLRRLVAWCCRQLSIPVRSIPEAVFRNRGQGTSGHCAVARGRIVVSIERPRTYELREIPRPLREREARFADPVKLVLYERCRAGSYQINEREVLVPAAALMRANEPQRRFDELVRVTAHEVAHRMNWLEGSTTRDHSRVRPQWRDATGGGSEKNTRIYEQRLLAEFTANRAELLADWSREPRLHATSRQPRAAKNEARARAALKRWTGKLQLARTKVAKYRAKVRRYDRIAASRAAGGGK
jgi:hypothetical protein